METPSVNSVAVPIGEYNELCSCRENWLNLTNYIFEECELSSDKKELALPYDFGDAMIMFLKLLENPAYKRTIQRRKAESSLEER